MNISRFLVGALVLCALPALAQPDAKPIDSLPYPLISPQEAAHLGDTKNLIALHLRDVTLTQAFAELQKQSGVMLDTSRGGDEATLSKHLSLDIETHSVREACAAILDAANVTGRLVRLGGSGPLNIIFGAAAHPEIESAPRSGLPAFQLHALNLGPAKERSSDPTAKLDPKTYLSLKLRFDADPQLLLAGGPGVQVTRAEDEKGRSLQSDKAKDFDRFGYLGLGVAPSSGQEFIVLGVLPPDSHKLAHLDGIAVFVLSTNQEHWEVPDVLAAKGLTHEFTSTQTPLLVSLNEAEVEGATLRVNMALRLTRGGGDRIRNPLLSSFFLTSFLRVTDAGGHVLEAHNNGSSNDGTEGSARLKFSLPNKPGLDQTAPLQGPFKLVFDLPTEFVQTEVPFSFSNLPLP